MFPSPEKKPVRYARFPASSKCSLGTWNSKGPSLDAEVVQVIKHPLIVDICLHQIPARILIVMMGRGEGLGLPPILQKDRRMQTDLG